jgi:hypothetical protein
MSKLPEEGRERVLDGATNDTDFTEFDVVRCGFNAQGHKVCSSLASDLGSRHGRRGGCRRTHSVAKHTTSDLWRDGKGITPSPARGVSRRRASCVWRAIVESGARRRQLVGRWVEGRRPRGAKNASPAQLQDNAERSAVVSPCVGH